MVRAKFIKAEPTQTGITYTLKGELDKTALHSAVDLQGEECIVQLATQEQVRQEDSFYSYLRDRIESIKREQYERGLQDAVQGNLLEEKGE